MTDPYRPPPAPERPRSICAECKHYRIASPDPFCYVRMTYSIDPVSGKPVVDNLSVTECRKVNTDGNCQDFAPKPEPKPEPNPDVFFLLMGIVITIVIIFFLVHAWVEGIVR